jgi:hypothetical protein
MIFGLKVSIVKSEVNVSKYAGAFLEVGVGARALGMGGAYAAVTQDVTSIYWNPAGLVNMTSFQLHGMHAERFAGIVSWDFAGIAKPMSKNIVLGLGFFRLGVDGIPITALRDPSKSLGEIYINESGQQVRNHPYATKYVNDTEMAFIFSFAKKKSDHFSFGGNIKILRKHVDEYGAWGIGFDAGILWNPFRHFKLAAVLLDGTSTLISWNTGRKELVLPHMRFGAAYSIQFDAFTILPVFDFHLGFEDRGSGSQLSIGRMDLDLHTGMEVEYRNRIALRLGLDRGFFTAGTGIKISTFIIDYGYMQHSDLGDTHRISLTISWN